MKNFRTTTTILVFSVLAFACKKNHDDHGHATPATTNIHIISPTVGQEIDHKDTAKIKCEITSPSQLHGYTITLTRLADTTVVYTDDVHTHQNNYSIIYNWVNNNTIHSDMLLTIDANIDHSGNKVSKSVQFHAHYH